MENLLKNDKNCHLLFVQRICLYYYAGMKGSKGTDNT
jgi:hypothetical protein